MIRWWFLYINNMILSIQIWLKWWYLTCNCSLPPIRIILCTTWQIPAFFVSKAKQVWRDFHCLSYKGMEIGERGLDAYSNIIKTVYMFGAVFDMHCYKYTLVKSNVYHIPLRLTLNDGLPVKRVWIRTKRCLQKLTAEKN